MILVLGTSWQQAAFVTRSSWSTCPHRPTSRGRRRRRCALRGHPAPAERARRRSCNARRLRHVAV